MIIHPLYALKCSHQNQKKTRCVKIALEGMPGAGKTSSLLHLVSELEGTCVVLSELLPEPTADWSILTIINQGRIYHDLWVSRMEVVRKLSPYTNCFLFDRTYFTNLAFAYATDNFLKNKKYIKEAKNKKRYVNEPSYEGIFNELKQLTLRDLKNEKFDLIIFLDISPTTGLARRNKINDSIPWLSSEKVWLGFLREFYHKELPKFYKGKIIYINTEKYSLDETLQKIKTYLKDEIDIKSCLCTAKNKEVDQNSEEYIVNFGKNYNLGPYRSEVVHVYGYPTIYYRKHSIQLVNGQLRWFNNHQLNLISKDLEKQLPKSQM
jgi:thymidylate kinase